MREIVIISGKGGTGKTSVTASFAVLSADSVIADCDVDAADLHLILSPEVKERHEFRSGHQAVIRQENCIGCGECQENCRFGAIVQCGPENDRLSASSNQSHCADCDSCKRSCSVRTKAIIREMNESMGRTQPVEYFIDPISCEGCGVCVRLCPINAIDFPERICGEWMVSQTRCGPMVHAQLGIAAENSGKLVSEVRRNARRIAEEQHRSLLIVDGPPGIGCPVIASVTGASLVLIVTEPTVSGEHDLVRVLTLTRHFKIPTAVCVNKWDLNPTMTEQIEEKAQKVGARLAGRIRYDQVMTLAQMQGKAVVEIPGPCADDVRGVWEQLGLEELSPIITRQTLLRTL